MSKREICRLLECAARARLFANYAIGNEQQVKNLTSYAEELEEKARRLDDIEQTAELSQSAMEVSGEPCTKDAAVALNIGIATERPERNNEVCPAAIRQLDRSAWISFLEEAIRLNAAARTSLKSLREQIGSSRHVLIEGHRLIDRIAREFPDQA